MSSDEESDSDEEQVIPQTNPFNFILQFSNGQQFNIPLNNPNPANNSQLLLNQICLRQIM